MKQRRLIGVLGVDDRRGELPIGAFFSGSDTDVVVTDDPERVVELARGSGPELIVVDLGMPGIDCVNLLARLDSDEATRFVPVALFARPDALHARMDLRPVDGAPDRSGPGAVVHGDHARWAGPSPRSSPSPDRTAAG